MTQRQRKQRRRRRHHTGRNSVLLGLGVLTVVAVIGVLAAVGYVLAIAATAPDLAELKPADKGQLSVVYAADGSRLGFIQSDVLRRVVPWSDIPVNIRRATVAIEDERFYKHGGVDLNAIVRAGIKNLESGKTVQGGSTITQQLVRALYIKDPKRDFARKIREAKLASELEDKHSKTWVLHNYLNSVPYGTVGGRTAIGIEAAAVTFFNKHARRLRLYQAALLAGLPQAPSEYNPFRNPEAALTRRNEVLRKMEENGYITQAEATRASQRGLGLRHGTRYIQRREPYFFDYVQEKLIERYGVGVVRRGGLRIHTTIDPKMQEDARNAVNAYYADPAGPSSAIVAIDPANGKIRAMASTGTYASSNFNLAAQGHRQPGSAFKTFVLTAAIRKGVDPDSTYYTSKPLDINDPTYGHWEVKTFGNSYIGTVSLTRATLSSDNTVYAQLILDLGPKAVCETAKLLGHHHPSRLLPGRGPRRPDARRDPAGDGGRVRDARERRRQAPADRHREGRVPRRQEREPGELEGQARAHRRRGLRGDEGAARERARRYRRRGQLRLPGGRQDRDHGRGEGRLVRGLHAQAVRGGVGRRIRRRASRCPGPREAHTPRPSGTRSWSPRTAPSATTSRRPPSRPSCRRTSASTPGPAPPARARTPRRARAAPRRSRTRSTTRASTSRRRSTSRTRPRPSRCSPSSRRREQRERERQRERQPRPGLMPLPPG